MFTGLVQRTAQIQTHTEVEGGLVLEVARPYGFTDLEKGESIAIDGICLTLTEFDKYKMSFFAGLETLSKTQIQTWSSGTIVNIERSLRAGDRLGGHMVSGHVDGTGLVTGVQTKGPCLWLEIKTTPQLINWMIPKGSVSVNGVSLTINNIDAEKFELLLIPETLARTNLSHLDVGMFVNLECDQTVKIISEQMKRIGRLNEQHP